MGIVPFLFFCNDTATTGIYTYLHTLSLHDALPICSGLHRRTRDLHVLRHDEAGQSVRPLREAERSQHDDGAAGVAAVRVAAMVVIRGDVLADRAIAGRSEEHTSELQSLMRISYAVFCLKTKNSRNKQRKREKTQ